MLSAFFGKVISLKDVWRDWFMNLFFSLSLEITWSRMYKMISIPTCYGHPLEKFPWDNVFRIKSYRIIFQSAEVDL